MKIKVIIPYYLEYRTAIKGLHELIHCKDHTFEITPVRSYDPGFARNSGIKTSSKKCQAIQGVYDYVLFIDSDIGFNLQQVLNLLEQDKDIISGAYIRRDRQEMFNCGMWKEDIPGAIYYDLNKETTGLHKVDFVGGGFLLCKSSVFPKIEYPWFRRVLVGDDVLQEEIPEDYGFCLGARKAGFELWVDCDVQVYHNLEGPKLQGGGPSEVSPGRLPPGVSKEIIAINELLFQVNKRYELLYKTLEKKLNAR